MDTSVELCNQVILPDSSEEAEETKALPEVDYKKGVGYPTRRAMLLQFLDPIKFTHQDHAGVLTRIRKLEMEDTQLEYEEYLKQIKNIKH
jgi:hypothetical protein